MTEKIKETKELLSKFSKFINRVATSYSKLTGVDKYELFGEGNVALVKAMNDFNTARTISFDSYAKYIIVDALNEYVRKNKAIVSIPRYVARANQIINRIKSLLDYDDGVFYLAYKGVYVEDNKELEEELQLLKNAASRAKVTVEDLVDRAEFLPYVSDEPVVETADTVVDEQKKMLAKLFVRQIRQQLTKEELNVADCLMEGLSVNAISDILHISNRQVKKIIKGMRSKVLTLLDD
jgi:RNA polymerase sigma factor (sigma-70 family)